MVEININDLVEIDNLGYIYLKCNIPEDVIIFGKMEDNIFIKYQYNKLNLFNVECKKIIYEDQKGESIKNHILPDSLEILLCTDNGLTLLPKLPNSLKVLHCYCTKIKIIPSLPENIIFIFYQDEPVDYVGYNKNIQIISKFYKFKLIINDNVITNQREWDEYMNLLLRNKTKSARK